MAEALERANSAMSTFTEQAQALHALPRTTGATTAEAAQADVMFKALGLSGRDAAAIPLAGSRGTLTDCP